jgi:uncharacterized membrane protein YhaH (DUF805 family)
LSTPNALASGAARANRASGDGPASPGHIRLPSATVGGIAVATAVAAVAATVANLLVRALAIAALDIPMPEFEPLAVRAVILSTLGGVIAAGIAFAVTVRRARNPRRTYLMVAAAALVLSFIPPLQLGLADPPENPGTDAGSVGTLMAMHLVAAAISVTVLIRTLSRPGRDRAGP